MTQTEALRLALEALERIVATCLDPYSHEQVRSRPEHFINQSITAIKAALEAKDEPVAWVNQERNTITWDKLYPDMDALYTTPPQRTWVGLTDEDISEIVRGTHNTGSFVRAIEAKLKEKNT